MLLTGRVIVVTGAATGIGAACAVRLAAEGASVAALDVDSAAQTVETIRAAGGQAEAVRMDVADEAAWADAVEKTRSTFGPVDGLVSNAYTVEVAPAHELPRQSWQRQLDVNLTAAYLGLSACHDDLVTCSGSVVLISSVHALVGLPGHPAYAASKGALVSLGRQLAVEYGPRVRVNVVLPGPVQTRAWARITPQDQQRSARATVAGRLGSPAEVAAPVAFLLSSEAAYVTGASLVVDGGWTAVKDSS